MDEREDMGMSVPASYFMHRGLGAPGSGSQTGLHSLLAMSRSVPNASPSFAVQTSAIGGSGGLGGGGSVGSAFQASSTPSISPHGVNITAAGGTAGGGGGGVGGVGQTEQVKRMWGRPRKYGPDGTASLALSPMSSPPSFSGTGPIGPSESRTSTGKRRRGRPPGTGRKQLLASLGEWVSGSAGFGFTTHIITIPAGEDIAPKIMSFSLLRPRAVCILSANGSVSTVTLRQPATSGSTVTYEGRFEILCLSGSYSLTDEGGSWSRSGGLSISFSGPDGRVIGGSVGGLLIASSSVQVILGSFAYVGSKFKGKNKANQEDGEVDQSEEDKHGMPPSNLPGQSLTSMLAGWPAAACQLPDNRNAHLDIDLMHG